MWLKWEGVHVSIPWETVEDALECSSGKGEKGIKLWMENALTYVQILAQKMGAKTEEKVPSESA